MTVKWIDWVKQIQSIAQAGLTYSKDVYDLERFQQLRDISIAMMSHYTKTDWEVVENLFASETGYQTPKVDIRAVIFQNEKLLFVKEKSDGKWALPGGWADIGYTPTEVAVKEVLEETGYKVDHFRLLAIFDKEKHQPSPSATHIYKVFIGCEIVGGEKKLSIETEDIDFFSENEIPDLSIARNTEWQIKEMFAFMKDRNKERILD
ncbi:MULTISPECIES: NUDIX hydrolase N-terminal domain-containing protein [Bacillus]|uniref:Phosphohydrolase (MutT/nudix family protein) n=2 Tax=Bacillus cereus group TaxID=86661 RepID=R8QJL0_BACCE|nr:MULTISPECIES: NUDIX hydrolase [Bacillus cereus group]EOP70994.1 phosphohydrolase (MutT/nudix family protein) [Bacillus cereus VD118]MBJ8092554.1 NUDIX hydrolase [Bacillus cereus]MCQ6359760.1 NUDIX hydrolase [Bacillus cereus]CAH2461848.1 ADP-ribose pyrophosphatase [Bacillus mycoides KBAB4]SCB67802.1 Phosphohydrolase (MutT/nudix family protein) [Bacillus mycoides]